MIFAIQIEQFYTEKASLMMRSGDSLGISGEMGMPRPGKGRNLQIKAYREEVTFFTLYVLSFLKFFPKKFTRRRLL